MYAPSPHDNESDVHAITYDFGSIRRRIIPYLARFGLTRFAVLESI